eukprot:6228725-Pyramimonas_sp.AAC.2
MPLKFHHSLQFSHTPKAVRLLCWPSSSGVVHLVPCSHRNRAAVLIWQHRASSLSARRDASGIPSRPYGLSGLLTKTSWPPCRTFDQNLMASLPDLMELPDL